MTPPPPNVSSTSFLLYNPGTERAHTVFRIAGNVGNGMLIRNLTTGQRCKIVNPTDESLLPGAHLELDSRMGQTRIVLGDSRELAFAMHDEGYIELAPCAQLNKKNLYLTFDDENGIGTAEYLLRQVLENTGWQLGYCETFYEQDGKTEKVRSISSDGKRGAYLLISDICALFDARPVFDGDSRTVSIYSLNRHEDLLELNFGKNLNGIDRKEDAENIVTRLYIEGDYGDDGYVGIEDVNPTGLPFLLDFSYFRELGIFTAEHEQALDDYLRDIQAAKTGSSDYSKELIQLDNQLNELWGQIDYVLYVLNQGAIVKTICGGAATEEQTPITATDTLNVLMKDGTHHAQTGSACLSCNRAKELSYVDFECGTYLKCAFGSPSVFHCAFLYVGLWTHVCLLSGPSASIYRSFFLFWQSAERKYNGKQTGTAHLGIELVQYKNRRGTTSGSPSFLRRNTCVTHEKARHYQRGNGGSVRHQYTEGKHASKRGKPIHISVSGNSHLHSSPIVA